MDPLAPYDRTLPALIVPSGSRQTQTFQPTHILAGRPESPKGDTVGNLGCLMNSGQFGLS